MGRKSKEKGKRGEREAAAFLRQHGFEARRGQQFDGEEGRDVVHSIGGIHIEVKRVERFQLYPALEQADADAESRGNCDFPVVMHRPNQRPWVAVMYAEDFLKLVKELESGHED